MQPHGLFKEPRRYPRTRTPDTARRTGTQRRQFADNQVVNAPHRPRAKLLDARRGGKTFVAGLGSGKALARTQFSVRAGRTYAMGCMLKRGYFGVSLGNGKTHNPLPPHADFDTSLRTPQVACIINPDGHTMKRMLCNCSTNDTAAT